MADTQPPHRWDSSGSPPPATAGPSGPGPAGPAGPVDLGGFVPGRVLGRGAHGVVVAARQRSLEREVALKRLPDADASAAARLRHEAAALAELDHPHIVRILDVVPDGNGLALVLPLAAGGSLADLLDAGGPLPAPEVAALGARLAGALASAHRHGLLHLDVKPSNVLLTADGEPLLADFGVAKAVDLAAGRPATGTPGFLAPEAVLGCAGPASDVWSLGVLLRRALDPARTDAGLEAAIARATAADPDERVGADGLAQALATVAGACPRPPLAPWAPVPTDPLERAAIRPRAAPAAPRFGARGRTGRSRTGPRSAARPALAAGLLAVVATLGLWSALAPAGDARSIRPPATLAGPGAPATAADGRCTGPTPVPAGARVVVADLGTGCEAEVLWWADRGEARVAVESLPGSAPGDAVGQARFLLGAPGDQLLLGDWTCRGAATPALHRPSTGEVFTFDGWAEPTDPLPSREVAQLGAPGDRAEVVPGPDGCDQVRVVPRA